MTHYYINMNDGRVIAGTDETRDNICYREIDISWAIAIRDGKVTADDVIKRVNEKIGMVPYSEWTKGIERLNVRSRDLHMVEHALNSQAKGEEDNTPQGSIGAFSEDDAQTNKAKAAARKVKVAVSPEDVVAGV